MAALIQEQLKHVIFPLGDYTKDEVYKLAKKWRLPHQPRQSFDICFAGDYQGFLKRYLKMKPGKIVTNPLAPPFTRGVKAEAPLTQRGAGGLKNDSEKIIGIHQCLPFYTIGQRASIGGPGPFYVVKKDAKKNILYVSNNEKDLLQKEMTVKNVNWLSGQPPKFPLKCKIKIRYQAEEAAEALIARHKSQIVVIFDQLQRAITPGQMAVFYGMGGEVLGGGIIKE